MLTNDVAVNLNCDENGSSGGRDQSNGSSNSGGSEENSSYGAGSQSNPPSFSDGDNDGSAGGGSQSSPPSYSDNDGLRGFLKKWSFGLGLPKTHSMHNWDVETQKENWEKGGFKAVTWFA